MAPTERSSGDSPASKVASFVKIVPDRAGVPILLAAPHGGRDYPVDLIAAMRDPEEACRRLEDRHADTLALLVARETSAPLIYATTPRAMIDLNRSAEDVDWTMIAGSRTKTTRHSITNRRSRSGLGLVPRRLAGMGEIWKHDISMAELERRIETVHRPYHRALADELAALRDKWGAALLLDIHSMPPLPRQARGRAAEFVVGDRFGASCDALLSSRALAFFGRQERPVAHNRPYSGGFVLDAHGAPRRNIHALQLEVCRSCYLDANLVEPSARLPAVARLIAGLVRELSEAIMEIGDRSGLPIAAE